MCRCLKVVNTTFGSYDRKRLETNDSSDLTGKQVITSNGNHGRIVESIINNSGKPVGYIINQGGRKFSIFKSDIIQII